uniref:Protein unc-93 homolog A n=1 Tax=Phallusia mammillata TaxID=59560 RepID=A0A6F9DVP5_9ASCI|nr:protein unc-93 homolog A-like [Phallusia mammillata]
MASCKCRRNVYTLAIAFLCNFTSYMTLESMQSSLNRSTGTNSLSALYTTLVVSSLLLPPLAIAKLDCRKSLFLSILMYAIYTLANFYPKPYILIPAAVLLGTGASVMWTAAFYYVMQVAQRHAKEKNKSIAEVTGDFFGKFTSLSHFSIVVGTLFMTVVFESLKIDPVKTTNSTTPVNVSENGAQHMYSLVAGNSSTPATSLPVYEVATTIGTAQGDHETCGLYFKLNSPSKSNQISETVMYLLLCTYLAFNIIAACLCLCLDEITGTETKTVAEEAVCASMTSLNDVTSPKIKATNQNAEDPNTDRLLGENNNTNNTDEVIEDDKSVFKLVRSSLTLLFTDKTAFLMIPFTLHYGMMQGFVRGTFNASWIHCSLGIEYVAYVTCVYGGVMIIGCYSFGALLRVTTHLKIFICTMSLEVILFVITLLWKPAADGHSETWIYFLIPIGFGICHSSLSSQLGSIYGRLYGKTKKAGTALLNVWNPMGSAIAYGLSGTLLPIHLVALVMSTCIVGTIMYTVAEKIQDKPYRKCKAVGGCL